VKSALQRFFFPVSLAIVAFAVIVAGGFARLAQAPRSQDAPVPPSAPTAAPATSPAPSQPDQQQLARGLQLYAANCAICHGDQGLGDGTAAYLLYPKPRNFSDGQFRITSTKTGLPSDADILQILRRGMPGSAMPSWGHLPAADLDALVLAVRELAIRGKAQQLMATSKSMKPDRATKLAHSLLDSGAVMPLPPAPAPAEIDLKRGQEVYNANCAACHDVDGRGRNKRDLTDNLGRPIFARDFTAGIFKGGADSEALARRIVRGMPGSPMPAAAEMPAKDLWSLVAYMQTFIKPGAQERVEQIQRTLAAARVDTALNNDPQAAVWSKAQSTFIPIMPLWWRDDRIEGVNVAAVHDGKRLAIRLSWDDATINDLAAATESFTDGAAIQLGADENPPLFAMGSLGAPVQISYWKASRQRDSSNRELAEDVEYPNAAHPDMSAPDFETAADARNIVATTHPSSPTESLSATGFGTLSPRLGAPPQSAQGGARRTDTGWSVVFLQEITVNAQSEDAIVALKPGTAISIAFGAWDGAAGDRNGQKSVSIWHRLQLEP